MKNRIYLNDEWLFTPQFSEKLLDAQVTDLPLESVRLPHTCKELPYHYFSETEYQMLCGYRRTLFAPASWQGKRVLLTIDGAAHYAEVFLNGEKCGEHASGYTAFTLDLSEKLRYGEDNVLVVRLDSRENLNIPPFGFVIDYMTYGGIYRDVYLDIKEPTYIADVFAQPKISGKLRSAVTLSGPCPAGSLLRQYAQLDDHRVLVAEAEVTAETMDLTGKVEQVKLWTLENPVLYSLETELVQDGRVVDRYLVKTGFRSAQFRKDGFYLNGKKLKLRGLNRHQSYPYVGYAIPASMQEFDADVLKKELGMNAVRTSHYPQSHYFLDRCDEIGLLVFTEIPGWQHIGDEAWKDQAVKNVEEMVLQYRNHPSIILWGVRINESADDEAFYTRTNAVAHKLDPTRQTGGVRCIKNSQLLEDVYTYNEFVHDGTAPGCEPKAKVTSDPEKPYLITEYNGHMFPTKAFDCEDHRVEHALRHARVLDAVASHEDICGSFGWCMADYNTHKDFGSGDRICYHGVLDMFRNPKLAAGVYACQQSQDVVLQVSSGMDIGEHPASRRGEVWIFSNADSVKMYKNDRLLKEYFPKKGPFSHLSASPMLVDDYIGDALQQEHFPEKQAKLVKDALNYIALHGYNRLPPKLLWAALRCMTVYGMKIDQIVSLYTKYIGDWGGSATAYRFEAIRDGKVIKTVTKTPMSRAGLKTQVSSHTLEEKTGYDVALVRVSAVDEWENLLPYCMEPLKIGVEGPIELIGPDLVSLKGGMTGVYVRSTGTPGAATLTLSNPQLGEVKIPFAVKIAE